MSPIFNLRKLNIKKFLVTLIIVENVTFITNKFFVYIYDKT